MHNSHYKQFHNHDQQSNWAKSVSEDIAYNIKMTFRDSVYASCDFFDNLECCRG